MDTITISTKEIRNDLEGFLKKLKYGHVIKVLYRSKPLVTIASQDIKDAYLADDAGGVVAARRSVRFVRNLPKRKPMFDSQKSFKELYKDTKIS
ncbi:MAG: hypothetical protein ACYDAS_00880 [Patescibacteria group bacterium]